MKRVSRNELSAIAEVSGSGVEKRARAVGAINLFASLRGLTNHLQRRIGLDVRLRTLAYEPELHHAEIRDLYHVVEDAITLAQTYRGARRFEIIVENLGEQLHVRVLDDGATAIRQDWRPAPSEPRGYLAIRRRAEAIGARVSLRRTDGRNLVAIAMPIRVKS